MARKRSRGNGSRRPEQGELRLIGGDWRRRVLTFPAVDDVRPTPARVRETLFNWVMPMLPGARCLDLFAGSGVLGLEALSREAASVTFVDQSRPLCRALSDNLQTLGTDRGEVVQADVRRFLAQATTRAMDLIMLDPPFRQDWPEQLIPLLAQNGWAAPGTLVYLEREKEQSLPALPVGWTPHREKTAGQVRYMLIRVECRDGGNQARSA
ncbi:16S rRNA (guanine(966)-N(2))-methyltransferase RsmD [Tamilnaduibacter salinus]|uniref:Ribosomal RNA small subunit methyltransferase D n=1 Tax=Tamilnaduibacter salinus TaxID=1484056 RepID=A0A2A2I144_9GAMM|nr:16S rRNA (guanine(966)-N(2))-methyltransferase RsmD [Tamilnaduibacter salinus]PAV24820.1 16S rRNA (guanine(966)-N(2))-methyltransferase RsmD [Tamilnaduibacter salinus]